MLRQILYREQRQALYHNSYRMSGSCVFFEVLMQLTWYFVPEQPKRYKACAANVKRLALSDSQYRYVVIV